MSARESGRAVDGDQESSVREGRRAPFKQLPDAVMDDDTISPLGKFVYWYLMRIASFGDHRARVSISKIAAKIGLSPSSRRTVREYLDELVKAGWLEVVHRKSPDGKVNLASDYVVHSELGGVGAGEHLPAPEHPGVGAGEPRGRGCAAPGVGAGEPHSSRSSFDLEGSSPRSKGRQDAREAAPLAVLDKPAGRTAGRTERPSPADLNATATRHGGYAIVGSWAQGNPGITTTQRRKLAKAVDDLIAAQGDPVLMPAALDEAHKPNWRDPVASLRPAYDRVRRNRHDANTTANGGQERNYRDLGEKAVDWFRVAREVNPDCFQHRGAVS